MSFVNPLFLFALSAIAIPVIIHLFNFRRFRKVLFSNVSFLSELSEEKKKQSKIKNLLVLLARILAIIFLVLAFTRPYIPYEDASISREGNAVSIYVDNSFSMEALSGRGKLLNEAKRIAGETVEAFPATDEFHLVTNDFEGIHQRFVSREDFASLLHEVEISPTVRHLSEIYQRQKDMLSNVDYESKNVFMISDFQKSISDFENFGTDTTVSSYLIPVRAQQADNIYIDSLWFESPVKLVDRPVTLNIRLHNDGGRLLENQSLRLYINDELRSVASFDVQPGETLDKQLSYTINESGVNQGRVEIIDFPVVFDDKMYFSFRVDDDIPVLVVNQSNESRYLNALFEDEETFHHNNMSLLNIDYSAFQFSDMIILNGLTSVSSGLRMELARFVDEGGSLVVFPGENIDLGSYREFLTSMQVNHYTSTDTNTYRVSSINELHHIYEGVFDEIPDGADLPVAHKHYEISSSSRIAEDYLLQLQNGNNFFTSQASGNGTVYLSAVPLDEDFSNFPMHPVFVPTMYNAALYSITRQDPYQIIGRNLPVRVSQRQPVTDPVYHIRGENTEVIPEVRRVNNRISLYTHDQVSKAGNYLLYNNNGDIINGISYNYDRIESKMDVYDSNELEDVISDHQLQQVNRLDIGDATFEKAFEKLSMGRELWQLCLILALVFFLAEVLLLRFWKK